MSCEYFVFSYFLFIYLLYYFFFYLKHGLGQRIKEKNSLALPCCKEFVTLCIPAWLTHCQPADPFHHIEPHTLRSTWTKTDHNFDSHDQSTNWILLWEKLEKILQHLRWAKISLFFNAWPPLFPCPFPAMTGSTHSSLSAQLVITPTLKETHTYGSPSEDGLWEGRQEEAQPPGVVPLLRGVMFRCINILLLYWIKFIEKTNVESWLVYGVVRWYRCNEEQSSFP